MRLIGLNLSRVDFQLQSGKSDDMVMARLCGWPLVVKTIVDVCQGGSKGDRIPDEPLSDKAGDEARRLEYRWIWAQRQRVPIYQCWVSPIECCYACKPSA
ncbi:hypothetical protein C2S51_001634 [Perilla frutescens var. frutescens]|nr:hypothetical protein C2S51_001634 [Perilla frutescens var. frutescens]